MKKTRKYKRSEKGMIAEKKARQHTAGSQSSDIGLITDEGKQEFTENQGSTKSKSYASTGDFVILVRESPHSVNTVVEDMRTSSDSDESEKEYRKAKYKPSTNDNNLYPEIIDSIERTNQENENIEIFVTSDGGNKYNTETEIVETKLDETDSKPKGQSLLGVSNIYHGNGKTHSNVLSSTNHQRTVSILSFEPRCLVYVIIACCVSIIVATLLSYISFRK